VDEQHIEEIRSALRTFTAGGVTHLVLEVVAYAADEAAARGVLGQCVVQLHADGSILVSDDGRGTDTRLDSDGRPVRKPVMGTKDLRFFDSPDPPRLPDGRPRRGPRSSRPPAGGWSTRTDAGKAHGCRSTGTAARQSS
jgi:DNA gyrase subunit B